jgi:ribonuclease Z
MTQIEVTFLGTTAGVPTKHRNHAAIFMKYNGEKEASLLFDCGEGTQRQMINADTNFMHLDHIFISHWHADHFAGLLGLLETMNLEGRNRELRVYGPEAEKFVPILENLGYSTKDFGLVPINVEFEGTEIQTLLDEEEFSVVSIPTKHGIPAVAYALVEKGRNNIDKKKSKLLGLPEKGMIFKELKEKGSVTFEGKKINLKDISSVSEGKKVVYSGDSMPNKNMIKLAKNADLLIHDTTFFEDVEDMTGYKHTRADDVMKIAKEAKAKRVIFTHISRRYQNLPDLQKKAKDYGAEIAIDFMKVVVK